MTQKRYFLCDHVYACFADDYCIFLDLKHDDYLSVDKALFDTLLPWLGTVQAIRSDTDGRSLEPTQDARNIASALLKRELITEISQNGKMFSATHVQPVSVELDRQARDAGFATLLLRLRAFFQACRRADRSLRGPLEHTVRSFASRKHDRCGLRMPFDLEAAERLIRQFNTLRFYFPRNYLCLFDSLALLEFLAIYNVFPTWVFGVKGNPFMAHCWVQQDEFVLNDSIDRVNTFVPIMAI